MTKKITFLGGIFLAVVASFLPFQKAFAIGSISVSGGTVNINSNITVSVSASGSGIWGGAMTLVYDPASLQFVSASNGGTMTAQTSPQQSGSTVIGDWYSTSATNGGTLATVTFKALRGSGSTSLTLSTSGSYASRLLNSDGNDGGGTTLGSSTVSFATPAPAPTAPAPSNPTPSSPTTSTPKTTTPKTSTPSTSTPSTPSSPDSGTQTPTGSEPVVQETTADDSNVIATIKIGFFDKNHKPLKKKKVTLHSDPQTAITDDKGYATFTNVPVGSHKAEYTAGKKTYSQNIMLADGGTRTVVYEFAQFSFPVWGWGLAALVVLAGVVAVFLMIRNRPKTAAQQVSMYAAMPAPAGSLGSNTPSLPPTDSEAGIQSRLDQIRSHESPQIGTVIEPDGTKKFPEDQ